MSKAHDPHWRYVAFEVQGSAPSRRAVGDAVRRRFRAAGWPEDHLPQLTRYEAPHGIVKVHHHRMHACRTELTRITAVRDAASEVPVTIRTLSSSGTIKTLTDRLGILKHRVLPGKKPEAPARKSAPTPRVATRSVPASGPARPPGRGRR